MSVQVKQRRKGGPWYVYVYHNGSEKWKKVGSQAAAKTIAIEVEKKLALMDLGFLKPKAEIHRFKEAANIFLAEFQKKVKDKKKKESTLERYSDVLHHFIIPHFGNMDIATLKKHDVFNFLSNCDKSNSMIALSLTVLSGVFLTARWQEWLNHDPLLDVRKKLDLHRVRGKEKFKIFTEEEVEQILTTCGHDQFYLMAFRTACRLGELLALEWSDIDLEAGTMEINKTFRAGVVGTTKNGTTRVIDLSPQLRASLHKKRNRDMEASMKAGNGKPALVFGKNDGQHTSQNTIRGRWKRLLKESKIEYRKFHSIRHTTISHLLAAGIQVIEVSRLAGHHSPSFTMDVYGHAMPKKGEAITSILDRQAIVR